jgi:hypothetical protein
MSFPRSTQSWKAYHVDLEARLGTGNGGWF